MRPSLERGVFPNKPPLAIPRINPYVFTLAHANPIRSIAKLSLPFAKSSHSVQSHEEGKQVDLNWLTKLSMIVMHILHLLDGPMKLMGNILEMFLNIIRVNGGFFGTFFKLLTLQGIRVPPKDSRDYLSLIGNLDIRRRLKQGRAGEIDITKPSTADSKSAASLCMMAAKFAYENEAVIDHIVTDNWNMHFVRFYNCWNDYISDYGTQAFVFMDKPKDAELVMIAFRGTEPFNARDWITDVDFSFYQIPGLGNVHVGFLEALGLCNRKDLNSFLQLTEHCQGSVDAPTSGLPNHLIDDVTKPLAFDDISKDVKELLKANPKAKLYITGHSLGGALSALYATMILYINDTSIIQRLAAIYTFGQPRIGDQGVADFMDKLLEQQQIPYYRVVYCNDLVPRVPPDLKILEFKHFGYCCYYDNFYRQKTLRHQPNKNFLSVIDIPGLHFTALLELVQSFFLWILHGLSFFETYLSTAGRLAGLVVPGAAAHSPVNYLNGVLLGPEKLKNTLP
eukprot:c28480_g1_i2 orf=166-1689(+)